MTLTTIAIASLVVSGLCALFIAIDEIRHPQAMGVMNVVWPMSALYFSVFAVWGYLTVGRRRTRAAMQSMSSHHDGDKKEAPSLAEAALGTSHCGAGCTIADVGTEFALASTGLVLFGSALATDYLFDFLVAWAVGILFQYFAIKPMRKDLSAPAAVWAAIKADTLSILAFQAGMYAWMALVRLKFFPAPHHLTAFNPVYWLMMQIAMVCGFCTSLPMNYVLIRSGLKEAM